MLNKGPYIVSTVRVLDDILRRVHVHQAKKRSMLRELRLAHKPADRQRVLAPVLFLTALLLMMLAASPARAASVTELDQQVDQALADSASARSTARNPFLGIAKGVLVFPKVYKAGIGVGDTAKTVDYDSTAAA